MEKLFRFIIIIISLSLLVPDPQKITPFLLPPKTRIVHCPLPNLQGPLGVNAMLPRPSHSC